MTNEIINIAVVECSDTQVLDKVMTRMRAKFTCYADDWTDTHRYELEFVSGNISSKQELDTIVKEYEPSDLYLQIISYELPNEYLEHHVFKNGIWIDKINKQNNKK
ncbi:MAG: hypothetical protein ACK5KL_05180 [Dysgonomonas sp.]